MAPKKFSKAQKSKIGQDKKTVLRVEPYMHFGKFTLRPFVDQGSSVYLPKAVSCEKKFFSVRKVLGTLSSENSELCRRPKKGLSMKSSTIQELGEFLTENKKDVLGTMEKLIGLFADEDGEKLLDACRFLNQQNEVSRDLDEATQHVAYLFDFFEGNRDGLESLLRKAAMIGSPALPRRDQSLGGGGPVHELQGLGQKGGPEKGAVQGRSRVARRSEERQQGQAGSGARRGGGGGPRQEAGAGFPQGRRLRRRRGERVGFGRQQLGEAEEEKAKEDLQEERQEGELQLRRGGPVEHVGVAAEEEGQEGSEEQEARQLFERVRGGEPEEGQEGQGRQEGHGHGKKAKKGQKSGKEAAKQDAAKGKESGKEGTKQEAAKQAMSAQEIKEVAFLDWSAGSIEEMYAQVEEVNGATRGDAKGIVPRDVIRVFVDSVPKKVLACYPLVQQAWDNIPEDQAEIPCAIAKSLLVKLLRLAGDAQEFFEQQSGAGAGGSSAP